MSDGGTRRAESDLAFSDSEQVALKHRLSEPIGGVTIVAGQWDGELAARTQRAAGRGKAGGGGASGKESAGAEIYDTSGL